MEYICLYKCCIFNSELIIKKVINQAILYWPKSTINCIGLQPQAYTADLEPVTCPIRNHLIKNIKIVEYIQYSKNCVKRPLSKSPKIGFQGQLSLNEGQKYCRMLHWSILQYFDLPLEHSAILLTFIKLPYVIKIFVLSILEWPFHTSLTVLG